MYFCGMPIKRDRVNRVTGLVYLPVDGSRYIVGDTICLEVVENDIGTPLTVDPEEMLEPLNGNAIGDAVFDAELYDDTYDNVIDANEL